MPKNILIYLFAISFLVLGWMWMNALDPLVNSVDFLDVGQGDAALLSFASGHTVLVDAGPDSKVVSALDVAKPQLKRIDLAVITHPQLDHFNGFNFLISKYEIGAFLINGRSNPETEQWEILMDEIERRNIPLITLQAPDVILLGKARLKVLNPTFKTVQSGELNDTALVIEAETSDWKALLTGDIGGTVEKNLNLPRAEILKVPHHGSKYSLDLSVLKDVQPRVALIGVGSKNSYGHPATSTLQVLQKAGAEVFRTDLQGNIHIERQGSDLVVTTNK